VLPRGEQQQAVAAHEVDEQRLRPRRHGVVDGRGEHVLRREPAGRALVQRHHDLGVAPPQVGQQVRAQERLDDVARLPGARAADEPGLALQRVEHLTGVGRVAEGGGERRRHRGADAHPVEDLPRLRRERAQDLLDEVVRHGPVRADQVVDEVGRRRGGERGRGEAQARGPAAGGGDQRGDEIDR